MLIADDERMICEAIQIVQRQAFPEIQTAAVFLNGQQAYDYLCANRVDILLVDIEMPGKSGLEIARLMQSKSCNSYVIIISAHQDFNYAQKAIDYGVGAFLTKPFSTQELVATLQKAILSINKKQRVETQDWQNCKKLLQVLCNDMKASQVYEDVFLCNSSCQISELLCTEARISGLDFCTLTDQNKEVLFLMLEQCVEKDEAKHSSFLLGKGEDTIVILIFSKEQPGVELIEDAVKIIGQYMGNTPQYTLNIYASFGEYQLCRSFAQEMDVFFDVLVSEGSEYAKKRLMKYVHALSEGKKALFIKFLREHYQVEVAVGKGEEAFHSGLDILIGRMAGMHSQHYIVDAAKEYIQKNCTDASLSLEMVADFLSVSNVYLSRIFKKYNGKGYSEYLLSCRMDYVQQLLEQTHLPIVKVAEAAGFCNPAYFRAAYKKYFGLTPSQFRSNCQKEKR